MGEEPPHRAERYRAEARRPRAADPADLMHRVYREYERRKAAEGVDRLRGSARARGRGCSRATSARATTFRAQYRAFTVDEYQDVNLLQQTLLDLWLGDRDDLCVVGDDYQSIYAFTGAGPEHLLGDAASASRTRPSCGSRRTTARRRRCSSSRTGSCRSSAAPRRCCAPTLRRRRRSRSCARSRRRRRRAPRSSSAIRALGVPARGGRDPLPHERAAGRLRGGAARGAASRSRARRCSSATRRGGCCAASSARAAPTPPRRCARRRSRQAGSSSCPTSSASASSCARPTSRGSSRSPRSFDGDAAGVRRRAAPPLRRRAATRRAACTCSPAPREGARVRGGLPAAARGEGAAVAPGAHAATRSPRSGACSTSG